MAINGVTGINLAGVAIGAGLDGIGTNLAGDIPVGENPGIGSMVGDLTSMSMTTISIFFCRLLILMD